MLSSNWYRIHLELPVLLTSNWSIGEVALVIFRIGTSKQHLTASSSIWISEDLKFNNLRLFTICMWDVRSLYQPSTLTILIQEMQKSRADIIAPQETRWVWSGIVEKSYCSIYYNCYPTRHEFGTGFIVNNTIKNSVTDFRSIISVHAPTEGKEEDIWKVSKNQYLNNK